MEKAPLTGTAKQVAWAEQIREKFIEHAGALMARTPTLSYVSPKVRPRLGELIQDITPKFVANTTSAKTWIDHTDLGTAGGVESFFLARLKRDAMAQALMQGPKA